MEERAWQLKIKSWLIEKRVPLLPGLLFIFMLFPLLAWAWATAATDEIGTAELAPYPWVFLRDGRPLESGESVVSLLAVGDIMLGRSVSDHPDPLGEAAGWLSGADLTLGNLEAVLVEGDTPRRAPAGDPQPILLKAPANTAELLRQAGFDILGVANNHSLDYGSEGLASTIDRLEQDGLESIGFNSWGGASLPLYKNINGVRLALLAFNAVPDPNPLPGCSAAKQCWPRPTIWNPEDAAAAIRDAKAEAAAVIVSMHWGFEYDIQHDPSQEEAATSMLETGADLIIGHHPHVVQDIAVDGDQVTAYSLGNFVFDQRFEETEQGLALHALFDENGLRALQVLPVESGPRPRLMSLDEGALMLGRVLPPPPRAAFVCGESGCARSESPKTEQAGLFYSGQIDLTGDGKTETVRREGERITIYEHGSAIWQSPPAWRVVDAALGDPNDDGRYEVVLSIWKKDESGHERSQPYIVGHRGGTYRLLWGGRAVADPIREVELGDVDGDNVDELIVIEELTDGTSRAVSVWRWTGWNFGLVWRSQPGWYSDLILTEGNPPIISAVVSDDYDFIGLTISSSPVLRMKNHTWRE